MFTSIYIRMNKSDFMFRLKSIFIHYRRKICSWWIISVYDVQTSVYRVGVPMGPEPRFISVFFESLKTFIVCRTRCYMIIYEKKKLSRTFLKKYVDVRVTMDKRSAGNAKDWTLLQYFAMPKFSKINYKNIYILKAHDLGYSMISFFKCYN